MFEKAALHITEWMEKNGIIESDKKIVVKWGIRNILDTIFNVLTFAIIGLLMKMPLETVIFTLGYIPLRSYAGGYHAKTPFRCWIVSNSILFSALMIVHCMSDHPFVLLIFALMSITALVILMPVSDIHKPLDNNDKHRYKITGIWIIFVEIAISFFFYVIHHDHLTYSIFSDWILLSIMLILGEIKNRHYQNQP